jgi:flavin-dependent dehydrogenase
MARVVIVGAGIAGQLASLLLAPEHEVLLLERDPAPPPQSATDAWGYWERRGVTQFRLLHFFQPRLRILLEQELPEVVKALDAAGALRMNPIANAPAEMTGGWRDGDEDFETITARRPVYEAALAGVVAATPSVQVRRGVAVAGLVTGRSVTQGAPHIIGVRTETGEEIRADLVVDASGRRSPLPSWLGDLAASAPEEEREDLGFVYYGRHFRSADGSVPFAFGPLLMHNGSFSVLTLPADNGTWGVGFTCAANDAELRGLKELDRWNALAQALPLVAHWTDGEPLDDGVLVMAKLEDRHRRYVCEGTPVATGVVAVADSWACTNPSVGRGATIGALHVLALRDVLRTADLNDPVAFVRAFDDATTQTVEPWYRATQHYDRHRLGSMVAARQGVPYEPGDPVWDITCALERGSTRDPDLLRAFVRVAGLLAQPDEVVSEPGILDKVIALGTGPDAIANDPPGPTRAELVQIAGG